MVRAITAKVEVFIVNAAIVGAGASIVSHPVDRPWINPVAAGALEQTS
jgi:hypothetical protein